MTRDQWYRSTTIRQRRAQRRQAAADKALAIALGVVMIFLVAFTLGGLAMLAGWGDARVSAQHGGDR